MTVLKNVFAKPSSNAMPVLGWVKCPSVVVPDGETLVSWCPEFGFRYVLVIARTGDTENITQYDATSFLLKLASGRSAIPIGIIPGIEPGFRARPGEGAPKLICTEKITFQDTSSPWLGLLYCIDERDTPIAVVLDKVCNEEIKELVPLAGEAPASLGGGETKILSEARLSLPYHSDPAGSMDRFSTFRYPQQQAGILAIGRWDEYCVVAVRLPEHARTFLSSIDSGSVNAIFSDSPILRDHSSRPSLGLIYPHHTPQGLHYLLLEKAVLSKSSYSVNAPPDSQVTMLSRYTGPVTMFAPRDWKLVFAFSCQSTGEILFAIQIGTVQLELPPDAVAHGFARQSN
jgi:hypothetical protein